MQKKLKVSKDHLVKAIHELLKKNMVGTHEEIREALIQRGFTINQAKISRILHKIGAIKVSEGERTVYRLPTEWLSVAPTDSLKHLIINISHNETLIVIQTAPGSAQLVARLLDQKREMGILGTVGGDDTIFVAPEKIHDIDNVLQKINKRLLGI